MTKKSKMIKEYLSTGDGTAGELLLPKMIMEPLIEEVEKTLLPREMAAMVWTPEMLMNKGSSFNINLEEENGMDVRKVAEGAEIPLDIGGYENVEFTPKKYGVAIRITREMVEDAQFELFNRQIRLAGRRFAEKETELIIDALSNGANSTVAGGAQLTIANITEAMQNLEDEDYMPSDMLIGTEVLNDLRNIDTFVEANKVGNTEMLSRGFIGTLYGMSVAKFSPNATSAPSTYKKYGFVFDRSQAYGLAIKRNLTVENFDLATYDMQGAALTWRFDVQLLRSKAVCKITTA